MSSEATQQHGRYPGDWPADCPPADALDASGEIYRLVKSNSPTARDLQTHHERGIRPKDPACLRCGLSMFRTRDDAEHQSRIFPKLGKIIARGTLQASHGKTKATGKPSHTTWWAYEGVDRSAVFTSFEVVS